MCYDNVMDMEFMDGDYGGMSTVSSHGSCQAADNWEMQTFIQMVLVVQISHPLPAGPILTDT